MLMQRVRLHMNLFAIGQQNLPIRNVGARFYGMAGGRDELAIGLKNLPIRNDRARFHDMAAETSLLLVKKSTNKKCSCQVL